MNTGFTNYRLFYAFGSPFLNYQAAAAIYAVIVITAFLIGRRIYRRLQVGK